MASISRELRRYLYQEVSPGGRRGVSMVQAYCVKCKAKREMKDASPVTLKNGKPATKGKCPVCGTTIMRIGAAK